jgi:uncharacterized membrane protein YhaH (DUF805 family)
MLETEYSFRGRLNRLQYFISCLELGATIAALVVVSVIALMALHVGVKSATVLVLLLAAPCSWVSLARRAKRFRDIDWNPLYVIPGWMAVSVVDLLIELSVPALAPNGQHTLSLID